MMARTLASFDADPAQHPPGPLRSPDEAVFAHGDAALPLRDLWNPLQRADPRRQEGAVRRSKAKKIAREAALEICELLRRSIIRYALERKMTCWPGLHPNCLLWVRVEDEVARAIKKAGRS